MKRWVATNGKSKMPGGSGVEPPLIETVLGLEPLFWRETSPVIFSAC
jgi:hypothetical protein